MEANMQIITAYLEFTTKITLDFNYQSTLFFELIDKFWSLMAIVA